MKLLMTILLRASIYTMLLTGGIALLVQMASAVLGGEIIVYSWSALLLFSFATLLWIIPVQVIDWLKLIKVQRRIKRIMFPYFVTAVQIVLFSMYMATISTRIADIAFSAVGLAAVIMSVTIIARIAYTMLVRSVRKYKTPTVQISAE
ncbi:hypothetical protein [Alkalicoccus daliensis]|uniref:Uncharacterized protein n=1 Tax=Alkalicoccus daliensis TaxID=745820 RepID=A0A1H0ECF9_9BACI|nr:hypothetical protein [Alkalicoccus daliensis]SDN80021.1 hypothetical protein SAMN04488053_103281 [Alkalicoccus daliensis]